MSLGQLNDIPSPAFDIRLNGPTELTGQASESTTSSHHDSALPSIFTAGCCPTHRSTHFDGVCLHGPTAGPCRRQCGDSEYRAAKKVSVGRHGRAKYQRARRAERQLIPTSPFGSGTASSSGSRRDRNVCSRTDPGLCRQGHRSPSISEDYAARESAPAARASTQRLRPARELWARDGDIEASGPRSDPSLGPRARTCACNLRHRAFCVSCCPTPSAEPRGMPCGIGSRHP